MYAEDLERGEPVDCGSTTLTRSTIQEFARQYDPQPVHTDPEAAADTPFGGLVASGWHTAAATMGVLVRGFLTETEARGAVGVDDLRFPAPVRPGDELAVSVRIGDVTPWSGTTWDEPLARVELPVTTTVDDETVLSMTGIVLWARRA